MNGLNTYIEDPLRILYGLFRRLAPFIKDDATYLKICYRLRVHKRLNLENPQTFSEKMQWLKLYNRRPEYTRMVDKYEAKAYVSKIVGEKYVIPTIGIWDVPEEINWDELPEKFVLKTTHGGGNVGVVICRDKDTFDKSKALKKLKRSLKQDIYRELREWPYKNVRKRIIAEPLLEDSGVGISDLTDYKFYCFDGEPIYCQVIQDRNTTETIDFFDMEWNHQEFVGLNPTARPATLCPQKPMRFNEMKSIAKNVSKNVPFVRVDLYEVRHRVYFGEITFYPASGLGVFTPDKYNEILGNMIALPEMRG